MSEKCPQMGGCAMFPLLSMSGTLKTWQEKFCSSDYRACARYQKLSRGGNVAPDLMPNGVLLRDLKKAGNQ